MQGKTVTCCHCQAEHTTAHRERIVHNRTPLYGPWSGWRMAGKDLVSPDGDRINPRRLAGILWAERARARGLAKAGYAKSAESIPTLPARERFIGSA
jgi:uncharacterized protein DUF3653